MNNRKSIVSGGALLAGSQIVTQCLRFVRNVILARLLSPADFGVAATFWITTGFLATISQLGFEQMLIRDKDGDAERVGATGQSLLALRGVLIGAVIFCLAGPIMAMFGSPESSTAFRWISLSTVLGGLMHRDTIRLQRQLRFGPSIVAQIGPDLIVTILAWPIAAYFGDYRAFIVFALLQSLLALVASHAVAERSFRLGWDRIVVARYLSFGWPLLLNSLLMFFVMQGDRMVLAQAYTKAELGLYSVAVGLAMTPGGMLMGIGSQLMLPTLAKVQGDRVQFNKYYQMYTVGLGAMAAAMGTLFILIGPALMRLIYGSKYDAAGAVIGWLGVMQCIRLLRVAPTTAALALGDTKNSLIANVVRQSGLALALLASVLSLPMTWIAASGVVGEILAVTMSVAWTRRIHGLPLRSLVLSAAFILFSFGLAASSLPWCVINGWLILVTWSITLAVGAGLCVLFSSKLWRLELQYLWQTCRRKLRLTAGSVST
ncbi:MAG: oligosaccharide flippase family protein [Planctomycetales bacterium]|nr:oligosaccharide flippase family protein [Planctomycetales bacterium]